MFYRTFFSYTQRTIHHVSHFEVCVSLALSTFTPSCNHYHHPSERFHPPKRELCARYTGTPVTTPFVAWFFMFVKSDLLVYLYDFFIFCSGRPSLCMVQIIVHIFSFFYPFAYQLFILICGNELNFFIPNGQSCFSAVYRHPFSFIILKYFCVMCLR